MNEGNPLVSVIVPAYNHENFVAECIESILNQTYENIEIIILNDGSTDGTAKIIKSYEAICNERFKRVVFLDKENEGICKTLNRGIKLSRGTFICCIASDDFMINECISKIIKYFNDNKEIERVISNFYMYYFDVNRKHLFYRKPPKWIRYMNNSDSRFLKQNIIQNRVTVFGIYRKSVFDKIGLFDENLMFEDWDMNLRIIHNNIKIGYVNQPLFYYRQHSNNISGFAKNHKFLLEGCLQIIDKIEKDDTINFKGKFQTIRKARSCKYIDVAAGLKKSRNKEYIQYILKAIREYPSNGMIYSFLIRSMLKALVGNKITNQIKEKLFK